MASFLFVWYYSAMTVDERIRECEDLFNQKEKERCQHLEFAEECLIETHKLQGEWRLLQQLKNEEPKQTKDKATTLAVVAEKVK